MSQKKPTTNQQLEEMREMIANLEPGKIVSVDRGLQTQNTTLMLMLYGATAKYGIGSRGDDGVIVTAQVPVLQVPADQSLQWEVAEDGKSVMLYIVLNEKESGGDSLVAEDSEELLPPAPEPLVESPRDDSPDEYGGPPPASISRMKDDERGTIADEFEDEIKVGLDGD